MVGAAATSVVRLIVRQGMTLAVVGILIGLLGAFGIAVGSAAGAFADRSEDEQAAYFRRVALAFPDRTVIIGSHLDSVPNGGWLDGCLNTLAGVEVLVLGLTYREGVKELGGLHIKVEDSAVPEMFAAITSAKIVIAIMISIRVRPRDACCKCPPCRLQMCFEDRITRLVLQCRRS